MARLRAVDVTAGRAAEGARGEGPGLTSLQGGGPAHAPVPSHRGGATDESWPAVELMVDPKEDRPWDAPP